MRIFVNVRLGQTATLPLPFLALHPNRSPDSGALKILFSYLNWRKSIRLHKGKQHTGLKWVYARSMTKTSVTSDTLRANQRTHCVALT